jgi:hypothetical protein
MGGYWRLGDGGRGSHSPQPHEQSGVNCW